MARPSIHAPWRSGPTYGHREPKAERFAQRLRDQCHRNAVHLFKTQGWVIDVGRLRAASASSGSGAYIFEIDGFTKPVAGARELDRMPERFTLEVFIRTEPAFDVETTGVHVPDVVLRCVKSTFNELALSNEAQLARKR